MRRQVCTCSCTPYGEPEGEQWRDGEDKLTHWEQEQFRRQLFAKRQAKQEELGRKVLLHEVSKNIKWREAAQMLTPQEFGTFSNEHDVKWSACFESSLKSECKNLPGTN